MSTRWGDDLDDSDDEAPIAAKPSGLKKVGQGSGLDDGSSVQQQDQQQNQQQQKTKSGLVIPPTHRSRVDSKGIQVVTSYRPHPGNSNQLWKTVTKIRISMQKCRESPSVAVRRGWKKFGSATHDDVKDGGQRTTIRSKDEVLLEDPHADTDLQEEDVTKQIAGNLNAFWKKQQLRQLERKYDIDSSGGAAAVAAAAGEGGSALSVAAAAAGSGGGWTQVRAGGASAAGGGPGGGMTGGGAGGPSGGKYIPPAARAGLAGRVPGDGPGSASFKPERRMDDLNTIRVTNISENTTEADLQDLFQRFGRISRVYLAKDKETLISRGFAFVSFVNKDDAARAMEALQGYGYDHLILKLEWARPNTPKDPATSGSEYRSGYGKALAQDTKEKVSFASNLTK